MNLHSVVSGAIGSINPFVPGTIQISTGYTTLDTGERVPAFATPGAFTADITDTTMTVSAITSGTLMPGQLMAATGIASGTLIVEQLSGTDGGIGTYRVSKSQTLSSRAFTSSLVVPCQVQPLSSKDIRHIEALNIQGVERAIYIDGHIDGLVRAENKGGDLITIADGPNPGTYLVREMLEAWPDWSKAAVVMQRVQS